jgi:hypothetical protein
MDVDLPRDSAVSGPQKALLQHMRDRLADVDARECRTCSDPAFDVSISNTSDEYQRCRADKHENGKLWSKAARLKYILTVSTVDSEVTARLTFRHDLCFFFPSS